MVVSMNAAANAYNSAARSARTSTGEIDGPASPKTDPGKNFSDFMKDSLVDSRQVMNSSEVMTQKAVIGEAELHEVVTAVAAAEVTLQTVTSVRDKMVQAYQQIVRMPI